MVYSATFRQGGQIASHIDGEGFETSHVDYTLYCIAYHPNASRDVHSS
jgi:hypothetical protein